MASKKKVGLGVAAIAAGAGAVLAVKNHKDAEKKLSKKASASSEKRSTAIQKEGKGRRTVKEFTTQMEIMRHLPDRKSQKGWRIKMLTL